MCVPQSINQPTALLLWASVHGWTGDALAMPCHWYYDSLRKRTDFGTITDYVAPRPSFPDSIMNLSNTGAFDESE